MAKREFQTSIKLKYVHLLSFDKTKVDELIQIGRDINEDVLVQMLDLHFSTSLDIINEMKIALDNLNLSEVAQLAHKFKSNSGQLGLVKLNVLCGDLEDLIKQTPSSDDVICELFNLILEENELTLNKLKLLKGQAA